MAKRVYVDGVFDLFHRGHLESLRKAKNVLNDVDNTILVVGVVSDKDCESYKRVPMINEEDRVEIIKNIKGVDEVIFPCPLVVTMDFIKQYNIDLVVHGFSNEKDRLAQREFFAELIKNDCFKEIEYYSKISTTELLNKMEKYKKN